MSSQRNFESDIRFYLYIVIHIYTITSPVGMKIFDRSTYSIPLYLFTTLSKIFNGGWTLAIKVIEREIPPELWPW